MKKIVSTIIAALICFSAISQEKGDTLKIKWKDSRIWIFDDPATVQKPADTSKKEPKYSTKEFVHWAGLDLGVNMLTTRENQFSISEEVDSTYMNNFLELNYGKSIHFSFNFWEKGFKLYKRHLLLVTGMGLEWNNYNFKKNITLDPDAPYISASNTPVAPDSIKFSKNKLKVSYIKIPLLLELNTNSKDPHKSFHITGGLEFAYKLGSKTKQVYEINGYEYKIKQRDDFHLADLKYYSTLRVGYGDYFTVFAHYGLSELFTANKGPEVYPFTTGLTFNF